jgi:aminopeptidase N
MRASVHDAFGAMENWGLVIFMSTNLLFNEKTSSVDNKKGVSYGE